MPKLGILLKLSSHHVPLEPKMLAIYRNITKKVRIRAGGIFSRSFDGDYCLDDEDHIITIPFLPCVILTSEERYKTYEDIIIMTLRYHYLRQAQRKHFGINGKDDKGFQNYNPIHTHITINDICIRRLDKYSRVPRGFKFTGKLGEIYYNPHMPYVTRYLDNGVAERISSTN